MGLVQNFPVTEHIMSKMSSFKVLLFFDLINHICEFGQSNTVMNPHPPVEVYNDQTIGR